MINFLDSIQITSYSCEGTKYFPIFQTAKFFIRVIQIAVPFVLIIFGSIDWFKALIAHDEKEMRIKRKPFLKRVIFAMLILILPWLVEMLSNEISGETSENSFWKCYSEAKPKIDFRKTTATEGKKSCTDFSLDKCPTEDDYGLLCYADTEFTNECTLLDSYNKLKGGDEKDPVISQQGSVRGKGRASGSGNDSGSGSGPYGSSDGSTVISIDNTKYVVVDTKYPGGVEGYQKMIMNNGVYQSSLKKDGVKGAGGCCGGISQIQACGLKKGMELTTGNVNKSSCNSSNISGCSGGWGSGKCFDDESSFVKYVIENVQKGNPVIINVGANKKKKSTTRHFLTVVGFKEGSNGTSYEDFLLLDSYGGYLKPITSTKRIINGKGVTIQNHPCSSNTKNYAIAITK